MESLGKINKLLSKTNMKNNSGLPRIDLPWASPMWPFLKFSFLENCNLQNAFI